MRIELRSSRAACAFIVASHLATAALVASLPVEAAVRATGVIAVGAHALRAIRRSGLRSLHDSIVAIELSPDRRAVLTRRDGHRVDGRVLSDSYVGELLTTLVVRPDGSRRSHALLLLPDMSPAEDLRRFRVLLRLGRPADP